MGKPIIPLCIEYTDEEILTKFGSPITVSGNDGKQEKAEELSAAFSTLKWDIYEYAYRLNAAEHKILC